MNEAITVAFAFQRLNSPVRAQSRETLDSPLPFLLLLPRCDSCFRLLERWTERYRELKNKAREGEEERERSSARDCGLGGGTDVFLYRLSLCPSVSSVPLC